MYKNESGDGGNEDRLDADLANNPTEHNELKNAVCETIDA